MSEEEFLKGEDCQTKDGALCQAFSLPRSRGLRRTRPEVVKWVVWVFYLVFLPIGGVLRAETTSEMEVKILRNVFKGMLALEC